MACLVIHLVHLYSHGLTFWNIAYKKVYIISTYYLHNINQQLHNGSIQ